MLEKMKSPIGNWMLALTTKYSRRLCWRACRGDLRFGQSQIDLKIQKTGFQAKSTRIWGIF
jgi:hypothetical protein